MQPDNTVVRSSLRDLSSASGVRLRGEGWHVVNGQDHVLVMRDGPRENEVWVAYTYYSRNPVSTFERALKPPFYDYPPDQLPMRTR